VVNITKTHLGLWLHLQQWGRWPPRRGCGRAGRDRASSATAALAQREGEREREESTNGWVFSFHSSNTPLKSQNGFSQSPMCDPEVYHCRLPRNQIFILFHNLYKAGSTQCVEPMDHFRQPKLHLVPKTKMIHRSIHSQSVNITVAQGLGMCGS
jgi:hypothetical protein